MSGIKLSFNNQSKIPSSQEVYIGFYTTSTEGFDIENLKSGGPAITWIYANASTNPKGNWYTLDDLSDGVQIKSFIAGRIYVCYNQAGAGGWVLNPDNPLEEPAQTLTQGGDENFNFWLRYDKMELTVTPAPADVADLTSIDFWSIPMSLKSTMNGKTPSGNGVYASSGFMPGVNAQDIYNALDKLSTPPVSGISPQRGQPYPALVPGAFNGDNPPNTYPDPTPDVFARIIGPSAYGTVHPVGFPITPYDTFDAYLTFLLTTFGPGTQSGAVVPGLGKGVVANVAGYFAGSPGSPAQNYNLSASIDNDKNLSLVSNDGNTKISIEYNDLVNPSGIYGANPPNTVNGVSNSGLTNDVNGWVIADLLGGLNIGAVGSSTKIDQTMVGAMKSQDWFSLNPTQMFANLQPAQPADGIRYYNQYAATLFPLSQAYNFAFTDRLSYPGSAVQVSLNQDEVNELEITLENATVSM